MVSVSWKRVASAIAICSCTAGVTARIQGFTAPASVPAGTDALVQLTIWNYVQNWQDYSIVWAWSHSDYPPYAGGIGVVSAYDSEWPVVFTDLTTAYQNSTGEGGLSSYWVNVTTPSNPGRYTLAGAVTYVTGEEGTVGINIFTGNITTT